ncbi:MAG: hypothetical protein DU429_05475 [Candidatus Tokpelaia sp.]|nr:MAG: hypothetical protein DU429_05475 [Candidatus Tokpelaia sp.]
MRLCENIDRLGSWRKLFIPGCRALTCSVRALPYMEAGSISGSREKNLALSNILHFIKTCCRRAALLLMKWQLWARAPFFLLPGPVPMSIFGLLAAVNTGFAQHNAPDAPPPRSSAVYDRLQSIKRARVGQAGLRPGGQPAERTISGSAGAPTVKRKFINSGVLRSNIKPPKKQEPDFPAFSTAVFVPKFFDSHERFERVDLSNSARLRFATTIDFFPFNYSDKNGILAGYNIDLVRAICAELRVENICRIEAVPWEELEQRLQSGGVDALIAGIAPAVSNRNFLGFSRAYMRFPARFMALRGSAVQKDSQNFMRLGYDFSEFLSLRGASLRVGTIRNTAHEKMLAEYFIAPAGTAEKTETGEIYKNALQSVTFADKAELVEGLKAKKIDLAFGDGMSFALITNAQAAAGTAPAAPINAAGEVKTEPVRRAALRASGLAAPAAPLTAAIPAEADKETCCVFIGGTYMGLGYLGQGLRIAVAEKDRRLASALNYALQQLERKGKLAELYLRYFPVGFY